MYLIYSAVLYFEYGILALAKALRSTIVGGIRLETGNTIIVHVHRRSDAAFVEQPQPAEEKNAPFDQTGKSMATFTLLHSSSNGTKFPCTRTTIHVYHSNTRVKRANELLTNLLENKKLCMWKSIPWA